MKIAFPTQKDLGLESTVFGHFGSAAFFVLVESTDSSFTIVENKDKDHQHGHCQPLNALDGNRADAVVVGGIGGGALGKLNAAGITVYKAVQGSVSENLDRINQGTLSEFTADMTCGGHGPGGVCIH
ncbi:MAG: NifB/NifX family molybdenum-iron cluster-binding protein [Desulfobacteraceae bacterium]